MQNLSVLRKSCPEKLFLGKTLAAAKQSTILSGPQLRQNKDSTSKGYKANAFYSAPKRTGMALPRMRASALLKCT